MPESTNIHKFPAGDRQRVSPLLEIASRIESGELRGVYIVAVRTDGSNEFRRIGNIPPLPLFFGGDGSTQ